MCAASSIRSCSVFGPRVRMIEPRFDVYYVHAGIVLVGSPSVERELSLNGDRQQVISEAQRFELQ